MKNNSLRILIVDDEESVRRFLKAALSSCGYQTAEVTNGQDVLAALVSYHPDIVILDLGLPDCDGIEVTHELRKRTQIPIIILSIREQESDKIAALEAGADDYLTKPFSVGELIARLQAVMRRLVPQEEGHIFKIGKLSVDVGRRIVQLKEQPVRLTPTEYDMLKLLVLNAGKVVTHSQLLKEVWNRNEDFEGAGHLLRVNISNLRSKIEPNPNRPTYILTEPGVGYRLRTDFSRSRL